MAIKDEPSNKPQSHDTRIFKSSLIKVFETNDVASSLVLVLKNTWRISERLAESAISHPGVPECEFGSDVTLLGSCLISVNNLGNITSSNVIINTPIIYRQLISTIGRPWCEHTSDLEILLRICSTSGPRLCILV